MNHDLKFQRTVLAELADIHATLAMLSDFVFSMQCSNTQTPEMQKQYADLVLERSRARAQQLYSQAGVDYPPESSQR